MAALRALPLAPAGTLLWSQELQDLDCSYSSALMCIPPGAFQSAARFQFGDCTRFGGCNQFQEQWRHRMTNAGVRSIECWTLLVGPARLLLLAAVCAVATPPSNGSFPPPPPETDAAALQAVRRHLCGRFGKCGTGAQESPEERKCDAFQRNNCNQSWVLWDKFEQNGSNMRNL